ncbi:hypothetical protein WUBG_01350 [Wuchereria bancrofti]|uniref:Uncharacterized protein n=1 Tax=Wuchereria bancrofti TaxID=6293 RepID=J9EYQ6_WUCBA|nr:hypothetical protein WUBG_01350 [Wuchereria bancrofti]
MKQITFSKQLRRQIWNPKLFPSLSSVKFQVVKSCRISEASQPPSRQISCTVIGYATRKKLAVKFAKTYSMWLLSCQELLGLLKQRLQLYCYSLEFLDSTCNMIVDEYHNQINEMSLDNNQTNSQHCKTLTLCG